MSGTGTRDSNWGRWGSDDERGTLNTIGPEQVQRAAMLVRSGRVFQLGMVIQAEGVPRYPSRPPALHLMMRHGGDYLAGAIQREAATEYVHPADLLSHHGIGRRTIL